MYLRLLVKSHSPCYDSQSMCKKTHEKQKIIKKTRTELAETLQNAAANSVACRMVGAMKLNYTQQASVQIPSPI